MNSDLIKRFKIIEKKIQSAQIEVGFREKQLNELRPKRKAMEDESKEKFNCPITKLPELLNEKEAELEKIIIETEKELEIAVQGAI